MTGAAPPGPGARRRRLYGRRIGRPLRATRSALLADALPRLSIDLSGVAPGSLDPRSLFAPAAPSGVWLEVGFGNGVHLAAQAEAHPDIGMIGCEPFVNGVAAALQRIAAASLANVRILADDARPLLDALAPASLDRVFVLFPDPWPKARHAKRRFISAPVLDQLARVMAPGAQLRVASDHSGYIRWALAQVLAHPDFDWPACSAADWRHRPADQPPTRYEEKARARGISPVFLTFFRRA